MPVKNEVSISNNLMALLKVNTLAIKAKCSGGSFFLVQDLQTRESHVELGPTFSFGRSSAVVIILSLWVALLGVQMLTVLRRASQGDAHGKKPTCNAGDIEDIALIPASGRSL